MVVALAAIVEGGSCVVPGLSYSGYTGAVCGVTLAAISGGALVLIVIYITTVGVMTLKAI